MDLKTSLPALYFNLNIILVKIISFYQYFFRIVDTSACQAQGYKVEFYPLRAKKKLAKLLKNCSRANKNELACQLRHACPRLPTPALDFGQKFFKIADNDIEIIIHSCKTILQYGDSIWVRKNNPDQFDIPMGSLHGAEACELVGLFLLDKMKTILNPKEYGLYRDDGLIVHEIPATKVEKTSKAIRKLYSEHGFKITIETGQRRIEFLDVVLDLNQDSFRPFRKLNSETVYIHNSSNHPDYIKREIPRMVNKRLNNLSKSKQDFDFVKEHYQDALKKSNYQFDLTFVEKNTDGKAKRKRRRKTIYFQPPFSKSVKTPLGRKFLQLVKKNFTPQHPLCKILNPKCIKISYCCLPNVKREITAINNTVRNKTEDHENNRKMCNCRGGNKDKSICPLNGSCLKSNIIYRADISSNGEEKYYVGSTGNDFKTRYALHKASLKNANHKNPTTLSRYYWQQKEKGNNPQIKWSIVKEIRGKFNQRNGCHLCNRERLEIARSNKKNMLNKRNELRANCPHYRKNYFATKD